MTVPDALPGDPGTLRQFAADLRHGGSGLDDVRAGVDVAARTPLFIGPAGARFRAEMTICCAQLEQDVERLRALVRRVNAVADEVEASQRARQAALDQLALDQHRHDARPVGS